METTSIVFVHYGMNIPRRALSFESLQSLYDSVSHLPCEIIVVDNGGDLEDSKRFVELTHKGVITHYIRNTDNLWFGRARNQAIAIASGEYIAVVDNDLIYKKGWLDKSLEVLRKVKNPKLMVTPMRVIYGHKRFNSDYSENGESYLVNTLAGSNCWVMRRSQFDDIGEFQDHHFSGTLWCRTYSKKGYAVIVLEERLVADLGHKHSKTFGYVRHLKEEQRRQIVIKKKLINGKEIVYFKGEI